MGDFMPNLVWFPDHSKMGLGTRLCQIQWREMLSLCTGTYTTTALVYNSSFVHKGKFGVKFSI